MSQTTIKLRFTHARPTWRDRLGQAWHVLRGMQQEHSTRRQLAMLDDRALSDIGISRAQAQFVAEQPIWNDYR